MHISRREIPGVAATTWSKKLKSAIGGSGKLGRNSLSELAGGGAKVHLLKDKEPCTALACGFTSMPAHAGTKLPIKRQADVGP